MWMAAWSGPSLTIPHGSFGCERSPVMHNPRRLVNWRPQARSSSPTTGLNALRRTRPKGRGPTWNSRRRTSPRWRPSRPASVTIWSTLEDTRDVLGADDRVPTVDQQYKVPHFDARPEADAV